jgi:glycosyltransferase involved in cell wall biosynthesis
VKKVLILHQHFKTPISGGAIRSYYLGQALKDHGIETVVITAHNDPTYRVCNEDGMEVHYLPIYYENHFGFFSRSLAFVLFLIKSVFVVRKLKGIDVCYAISTPLTTGLAANLIRKFYGIPYIFEVGDLWPEAPIQMGFVKNNVLKKVLYWIEKYIYQNALRIVALSPMIKSAIEKIVPEKNVHLIPNMADTNFYTSTIPSIEYSKDHPFTIAYIGAVGLANELEHLLACAKACQEENLPVKFIICGEGARLSLLKELKQTLGLENLSFIPFQNRAGVNALFANIDAAFVSYKPIPILETGSPNKFFDGLAAGKMIIVNFSGWIRYEIEKYQCGVYVDPHHPKHFCDVIRPYLKQINLVNDYKKNARTLALSKYSREKLSKEFIDLFLATSYD